MIVLGIDLETSGFDRAEDGIVELGACLYDTDSDTPVHLYSEFVKDTEAPRWGDEHYYAVPVQVCGITRYMVETWGMAGKYVATDFNDLLGMADVVIASNGNVFDRPMALSFLKRYGVDMLDTRWIDLIVDVPFPKDCTHRNLLYLAAYHGFLNPFPHRALFDVMTMMKILSCYPIDTVLQFADSPMMELKAHVSYDNRDLAKVQGFKWESKMKKWYKHVKECMIDQEEIDAYQFKVSMKLVPVMK